MGQIFYSRPAPPKVGTPVPQGNALKADFKDVAPMLNKRMHANVARKNKMRFRAEIRNPQTSILRKLELAGQYGVFNEKQFISILKEVLEQEMLALEASPLSFESLAGGSGSLEAKRLRDQ